MITDLVAYALCWLLDVQQMDVKPFILTTTLITMVCAGVATIPWFNWFTFAYN